MINTTIYNSYNVELAAKYIQSTKLSNFTEIYSLTNEKKYDVSDVTQKHLLCKQFVAWSCNRCSSAPLSDYINNPVHQELIDEDSYNGVRSDEKVYLDLRASSGYTSEAEKLEQSDSKINLFISDTARDFFYFLQSFGDKLNLDFVNLWVVKERIQDLDTVNCGIFQIYFYDNLFNPDQNSKIQNKKRLKKKTTDTLLNELFVLNDQEQNESNNIRVRCKRKIVTE